MSETRGLQEKVGGPPEVPSPFTPVADGIVTPEKGSGRRLMVMCKPSRGQDMPLSTYATYWLQCCTAVVKPRTLRSYRDTLRLHILPTLGILPLRCLSRRQILELLRTKLAAGLSKNSVRIIHATLRAMLTAVVDDEILPGNNPALGLGRRLHLTTPPRARQEQIKAFTRQQLATFLNVARKREPRVYPLLLLLARTGMRLGEALALRWEDLDFTRREVRVARALSAGRIETPKNGHGRTVDMSHQLAETLRRCQPGPGEISPGIFCTATGTWLDESKVRKIFKRILRAADLPSHFSPHALRHTFASLLLQHGESLAYVQRQLGHASIQLTVDTYGRWLPMENKAAVDRLDDTPQRKK